MLLRARPDHDRCHIANIDRPVVPRGDKQEPDIRDTGKGIPKSMFKTIFKPGFTTKNKGWGLGLSLAKRIVEDYHDGKIFVHQSELNKGSVIRIVLKK